MSKPNEMKILLVDDKTENIDIMYNILKPYYSKISIAKEGRRALSIAEKLLPDIILLDVVMPDIDGYETCRHLKANKQTSDIPVIFITGKSETEDLVRAFDLGAVDFIVKPISEQEVLARVKTHLKLRLLDKQKDELLANLRSSESTYRALFENSNDSIFLLDETGFIDFNERTLEILEYTREELLKKHPGEISPPLQADQTPSKESANNKINQAFKYGSVRFEWLHRNKSGKDIPCDIVLSAIDIGSKKIIQAIVRDITHQKQLEEELTKLATVDSLTGAFNRRHFINEANLEIERCLRNTRDLSVLLMDIDYFKQINDAYGHAAGDKVLKQIVITSQTVLRQYDILGRIGGEEFAILLPETNIEEGQIIAERIRQSISDCRVNFENRDIHFTTSIGLSDWKSDEQSIDVTLNRADKALYRAKEEGRDRVILS